MLAKRVWMYSPSEQVKPAVAPGPRVAISASVSTDARSLMLSALTRALRDVISRDSDWITEPCPRHEALIGIMISLSVLMTLAISTSCVGKGGCIKSSVGSLKGSPSSVRRPRPKRPASQYSLADCPSEQPALTHLASTATIDYVCRPANLRIIMHRCPPNRSLGHQSEVFEALDCLSLRATLK